MTLFVQITGCVSVNGNVAPFMSNEEAEFYGVYVGKPGEYRWQADFLHYEDAMVYALAVHKTHGCLIDDKTYMDGNSNEKTH